MPKIFAKPFFLLFLVFNSIQVWSLPDIKDSAEAYNYWVKRGITEVIYRYMIANQNDSVEKTAMANYHDKYIREISKKSIQDIESNFNSLYDFLCRNHWKKTAIKILKPLKESFEMHQKFDHTFFSVIETHSQLYAPCIDSIISEYNKSIHKKGPVKPPTGSNNPNGNPGTSPTPPQPPPLPPTPPSITFPFYFWIVGAFILGLFIGGILIYCFTHYKVLNILSSEKYEYKKILQESNANMIFFKYLSLIKLLKKRKDEYKFASEKNNSDQNVTILKKEIADLKRKNDELLLENIGLGEKLDNCKLKGTSSGSELPNQNGRTIFKKILYYSIPELDGTFKSENAKEHQEQGSFYKLEILSNSNGKIYFLSGDFDLRAIENIDYYINPVCEVQNISNRDFAKRVEMTDPGTIVLKGNSWQINNKVKIKLV